MELQFSRTFKKEYKKMTASQRCAFDERIALFIASPHHPLLRSHKLHGKYVGYRSINITGDIRAIFCAKETTAVFVRIGTHAELYGE
jgi:addiction module RelE/StbE family toxin